MKTACLKIIAVCAAVGFLSGNSLYAEPKFNEIDGQPVHSQADLDALSTGDTVVMACPGCKSMTMTTYNSDPASPRHVKWLEADVNKTCKACGGKLTAEKDASGGTKYVCSACGTADMLSSFKTAHK
jgi:hypothetical protein